MTREQYEMLQWLPKGEQAAMLQAQNAQFADGNADDLSAMRSATNAGVGSVFDQEQNGTFDAVSDPNSETVKSETTTTNADGTKTTTTTSNPNNSPSARIAEDAKNPDQIRVSTSDGRFSAMIDPSMLEQYAAAGYKPGPQTATPNGGTMTTPQSSNATAEGAFGIGTPVGGDVPSSVFDDFRNSQAYQEGLPIPGNDSLPGNYYPGETGATSNSAFDDMMWNDEAMAQQAAEGQAMIAGGLLDPNAGVAPVDPLSTVMGNPNVSPTPPVVDTTTPVAPVKPARSDFQSGRGGNKAYQRALRAFNDANPPIPPATVDNNGNNRTILTARGVRPNPAFDPENVPQANATPSSEFDSISDEDWAAQEAAEDEAFMTQNDASNAMEAQADAWAEEDYQEEADKQQADLDWWKFENDANGDWEDGATEAAIERDKNEGGFFEQIMNGISDLNEDTIQPWLESVNEWYKDNPVLASALASAATNYITTGRPFESIGKGVQAAATTSSNISAAESKAAAAVAKDKKDLLTWQTKEDYKFNQDILKEQIKQRATNVTDAQKAESDQRIAEHSYAKEITGRLEQNYDKATMAKFFPGGLQGEVSGALKFIRDNYGVNVGNPDFDTDEVVGVGIKRYIENLERNPKQKGKAKLKTFFEDSAIMARGVNNGIDAGLFLDDNGLSNPESTIKAYEKIKVKAKKLGGNREETWRAVQTAYAMFQKNTSAFNAMLSNAKDQGEHGTPPFIYFINHEVNLVE